jgi:hypothetical protein
MLAQMNIASANAETCRAADDHGRPIVWLRNVALVDVRRDFPSPAFRYRDASNVRFVSIHHDAVFYDVAPTPEANVRAEMERLDAVHRYHLQQGWGGIGYHTYGFPSGRLYLVGDFNTQRANVAGRNHESIGHCVAGDFTTRTPPIASQLVAAMAALAAWAHLGRLVAVLGHRDVALASAPTSCPGDTWRQWVPRLPQAIEAIARQRA